MEHLNSEQEAHQKKTYSNNYLIGYLIKHHYLPVDSKDEECIVFFNPRKNQFLKFSSRQRAFSKMEIKELFSSEAMDLPKKAEWLRFRFFKYTI
ncbi:hypothetical protein [uncultured Dokdonia sp.]|uniref:hypothetical protein n=1 Tax=uncultured Dokdonia sp. TaxID=575653 RepID=UPI0026265093|nr:hypothetical protein [uncultured Dokdonia sp.]